MPVRGEVAVGVVGKGLAGEAGQLVEVVVGRRLVGGRGALEQGDVAGGIERIGVGRGGAADISAEQPVGIVVTELPTP